MQPSLKLERAPSDWGAEAVSCSQLSREWVSALIRPGAVPCRVRVRADTGQLEMVEEMGLGQLTQVTGSAQCALLFLDATALSCNAKLSRWLASSLAHTF